VRQKPNWGLFFGISAPDDDFLNPTETENMKFLERKLSRVMGLLGADQKTFAGILPSLLVSRGIVRADESVERKTTVAAVKQAIERVKELEQMVGEIPVIVLGGAGFIGSGLLEGNKGNSFYPLELGGKDIFLELA